MDARHKPGFAGRPVLVADWENENSGAWRVITNGDPATERLLPRETLLTGELWSEHLGDSQGCDVIVERAHLHPRRGFSVAQVFTADELEDLCARADADGVRVFMFPQRLTPRARGESGHTTTAAAGEDERQRRKRAQREKANDPMAIYEFVARHGERLPLQRLKRATPQTATRHAAMNAIRSDMNSRLNQMRQTRPLAYSREHPDVLDADLLLEAILALPDGSGLSADTKAYFGLTKRKRTGELNPKWTQVMSVYASVFDGDQMLRRNPAGDFVGRDFLWRMLMMSPYHGGSGTARSNLMHHGLRHYARDTGAPGYADDDAVLLARAQKRQQWSGHIKELLRAFRDAGLERETAAPGI